MDALIAKAALSFVVGGAWITLAVVLAERRAALPSHTHFFKHFDTEKPIFCP